MTQQNVSHMGMFRLDRPRRAKQTFAVYRMVTGASCENMESHFR